MELFRTLGALLEPPVAAHRPLADLLGLGPLPSLAAHTDLFRFQLYPYASVYLEAEGMLGGEARDRIAGFWRALGLVPPEEADELTVMLAFQAELGERQGSAGGEGGAALARARRAFFGEHLASWLPAFLAKLGELAPPYYARWGELLGEALAAEREACGPPDLLPRHLVQVPAAADPRADGSEAFLTSLLSPARSGMILVRDDLLRAARELGLGARVGERRFVLKALLAQEAAATLGWLADEALGWEARHAAGLPLWGAAAAFWQERAARSARLCAELAAPL